MTSQNKINLVGWIALVFTIAVSMINLVQAAAAVTENVRYNTDRLAVIAKRTEDGYAIARIDRNINEINLRLNEIVKKLEEKGR